MKVMHPIISSHHTSHATNVISCKQNMPSKQIKTCYTVDNTTNLTHFQVQASVTNSNYAVFNADTTSRMPHSTSWEIGDRFHRLYD